MDDQSDNEDDDESGCAISQRYWAVILAFVSLCHGFLSRTPFYVAIQIIAEHNTNQTSNSTNINCENLEEEIYDDSIEKYEGFLFDWDETVLKNAFNCFFGGYICCHVIAGYLSDRYGAKYTVAVSIVGTSLTALFTPVIIKSSEGAEIVVYIMICMAGIFHSFLLPGVATFLSHWIPKRERALLCSIAFSGIFCGVTIRYLYSGILIRKTADWTVSCYLFGGIGIPVFIFWWFFAYSDPSSNPYVLPTERKYLKTQMRKIVHHGTKNVPLMKIFLSVEVWVLVVGSFGHLWLWNYAIMSFREYMRKVLKYSIGHSRQLFAVPISAVGISSCVSGYLADWLLKNNYVNLVTTRKVFTNVGNMGPAIYIVVGSFASCHRKVFTAMYAIAATLAGCLFGGIRMVPMDIAPNYCGFLTAVTNSFGLMGSVVGYNTITQSETIKEYRNFFFFIFGIACVSNIIFVIGARIKLQEWNTPTSNEEKNK